MSGQGQQPRSSFAHNGTERLTPREPFAVRHFHHARYSLLGGIDQQNVGLAAARDKLVFGMFETTGNIWSLPSLPRP